MPNTFDDDENVLENNKEFRRKIQKILNGVDFDRIENINTIDDLMKYILEYFEDKIMRKEKFQKVCVILI